MAPTLGQPMQPMQPARPLADGPAANGPNLALLLVAALGGVLLAVGQTIQMMDTLDDADGMEGDEKTAYVLANLGMMALGLALMLGGIFSATHVGARVALVVAGGYFLVTGSTPGMMAGFFGSMFGGFPG